MALSLSPISSIACCQDTLVHWPLTSFIGYFRRRSPCTSSRVAAPLAQCEPRLIGESQPGSCPTHTPLTTSPMTVQPTEQCVQTFFLVTAPAVSGPAAAASALRTLPSGSALSAASPPPARPERRRKLRRSSPVACPPSCSATVPREAASERVRCVFLISTAASFSADSD